jgi:hypothetical protein
MMSWRPKGFAFCFRKKKHATKKQIVYKELERVSDELNVLKETLRHSTQKKAPIANVFFFEKNQSRGAAECDIENIKAYNKRKEIQGKHRATLSASGARGGTSKEDNILKGIGDEKKNNIKKLRRFAQQTLARRETQKLEDCDSQKKTGTEMLKARLRQQL